MRYVVQTVDGMELERFESAQELTDYIDSRMLRVVERQRIAIPPAIEFNTQNWEYSSEMIQMDYYEILTVQDSPIRRQLNVWNEIERDMLIRGNWDFPILKPSPNEKEIKKARKLLLECLNEQEKEELENFNTVTVNTKIGMFRINMNDLDDPTAPVFNVIYKGHRYCAVLNEDNNRYPGADHFVAQFLLIKNNPKKFLRTANKSNRSAIT